jgi:hypothetical protein
MPAAKILYCLTLSGLWLAVPAQAQMSAQKIFICKDASGRTLTSDRTIPECANQAVREMDRNGVVRRELPAPLTPEQKRQKQLDDEKRKAEEIARAEQKQSDRALLARYGNEKDIANSRQRSTDIVREQIKRENLLTADAEKQHKNAQTEIAALKDPNKAPPALRRKLEDAERTLADSRKRTKENEAELAAIEAKFDATLKRYRELTITSAAK